MKIKEKKREIIKKENKIIHQMMKLVKQHKLQQENHQEINLVLIKIIMHMIVVKKNYQRKKDLKDLII